MHLNNGLDIPPANRDILETTITQILQTYNASMWIPGPSSIAGNFVDSSGYQPLSAVGDLVGYVDDESSIEEGENLIQNSEMVGATGVTPPNNWTGFGVNSGTTFSYVGTGSDEDGPYVDIRLQGTATAVHYPVISWVLPNNAILASVGDSFSMRVKHQIIAGDNTGLPLIAPRMQFITAALAYVAESAGAQATSVKSEVNMFYTVTGATIAHMRPQYQFNVNNGAVVDCTVRIWRPQCNRGRILPYCSTTGTIKQRMYSLISLSNGTTGQKPLLAGGLYNYARRSRRADQWTLGSTEIVESKDYADIGKTAIYRETVGASNPHFLSTGASLVPDSTTCFLSIYVRYISGNPIFRLQSRKNDSVIYPFVTVNLASGKDGLALSSGAGALGFTLESKPFGFKKITLWYDSGVGGIAPTLFFMTNGGNSSTGDPETVMEVGGAYMGIGTGYEGTIPETTVSVGAWQSAVPYFWQFDGVDDRLIIPKNFLNPAADHFIIAAFKMPAAVINSARAVLGYGNAGPQERLQLIFLSNNIINCFWRDAAGVAVSILSGQPARAVNEKLVVVMRKKTGQLYGSVKGDVTAAAAGTTADITAAWTPTAGAVGVSYSTGGYNFQWNSDIYGVIAGNGAPTDSEIAAMEQYLIGCAGFTPVP